MGNTSAQSSTQNNLVHYTESARLAMNGCVGSYDRKIASAYVYRERYFAGDVRSRLYAICIDVKEALRAPRR